MRISIPRKMQSGISDLQEGAQKRLLIIQKKGAEAPFLNLREII